MAEIHATAVIEPGAELGESVSIGPYSVVRAHVRILVRVFASPPIAVLSLILVAYQLMKQRARPHLVVP